MKHPVVVTVIHHPDDKTGIAIKDAFVEHFDKLGMDRAGIQMRIPVRVRSEPLHLDGRLKEIDAEASTLNVVVVLHGAHIGEKAEPWEELCKKAKETLTKDGNKLLAIVAPLDDGWNSLGVFSDIQTVAWSSWTKLDRAARCRRLLIHVVNAIRRQVNPQPAGTREKIFVSHAKADGREIAEGIVRHVSDPKNGLRLDAFYDALQLESGEDWAEGLKQAATTGSLLALVSDAYDCRPWCNQEVLWAKEKRRPILLVDIGRKRVGRSFPYAGNVPLIRDPAVEPIEIERVLLELLCEALRCDLFGIVAGQRIGTAKAITLPRPPELADLAFWKDHPEDEPIVYPDPPLPGVEVELLQKAANGRRIVALGDYP